MLLGYIDGTKSGSSLVNISSQIQIDDIYNLFDAEYKPSNISVIPDYGHYETTWETIKKLGNSLRLKLMLIRITTTGMVEQIMAANPLGTVTSAHETNPLPHVIIKNPLKA